MPVTERHRSTKGEDKGAFTANNETNCPPQGLQKITCQETGNSGAQEKRRAAGARKPGWGGGGGGGGGTLAIAHKMAACRKRRNLSGRGRVEAGDKGGFSTSGSYRQTGRNLRVRPERERAAEEATGQQSMGVEVRTKGGRDWGVPQVATLSVSRVWETLKRRGNGPEKWGECLSNNKCPQTVICKLVLKKN